MSIPHNTLASREKLESLVSLRASDSIEHQLRKSTRYLEDFEVAVEKYFEANTPLFVFSSSIENMTTQEIEIPLSRPKALVMHAMGVKSPRIVHPCLTPLPFRWLLWWLVE